MNRQDRDRGERGTPAPRPAALALVSTACAGLVFAAAILSPSLIIPWPALAYALAFLAVTGMTLAAALAAPVMGWRGLTPTVLAATGALVSLVLYGEGVGLQWQAVAVTAALLFTGASIGGAVGGHIEHPGHLLAVVVVSLMVDSFSVFHEAGPTAAIVQRPALLAVLALPWPVPGTSVIAPVLGVGDVVFAALYVCAARKFELGLGRTAVALAVGLLLTMVGVLLTSLPLPALVAMGLSVLVVHPEARRLPRSDRRTVLLAVGALILLWAALLLRR